MRTVESYVCNPRGDVARLVFGLEHLRADDRADTVGNEHEGECGDLEQLVKLR